MTWLIPAVIASCLATVIFTVTVGYLYYRYRRPFLRTWTVAWGLYGVRFACMLGLQFVSRPSLAHGLAVSNQLAALWSGILLLAGVYQFAERVPPRPYYVTAALLTLWVVPAEVFGFPFFAKTLPVFLFLGYVNVIAGLVFLQYRALPRAGRLLTGWSFILWGIHKFDYPWLRPVVWFAPWGYLLGATLETLVALGTLLTYFEKTHQQLQDQEKRLQLALEGGDLAIWDVDLRTGKAHYNDRWYTMLGYEPGELPTTKEGWQSLLHPEDRERVLAAVDKVLTTPDTVFEEIFRLRTKGGDDYRWILGKGRVVDRDAAGRPLRLAGTHMDVTAHKQLEGALRQSETTYRTLTANLPDLVYRIDVKGGGRIQYFNDAARAILGYSPEELHAGNICPIEDLIVEEDRLRVVSILQEAIDYQKPFAIQYRLRDKQGTIHYVSDKGMPIFDDAGELVCIDGLIHDLTEIKEAERERENLQRQLRQAQKMEAIGTLAGGIAHDFNNILSAIIGFTELSLYENPDMSPSLRANLEEVMQAANRARTLVKQILTFSRQQEQDRTRLHLHTIVKEVIAFLRATVPSSITIDAEIDEHTSPVLAEPTQIHQLLMNLATNAVQAMDGKGRLFVFLGDRQVGVGDYPGRPDIPPGRYVCLEVRDTGCGMEDEILERIFDPFFTTKEPGQGTGMGLAVVYGIVQRHKGYIVVHSRPGEGSTFTVLLPPTEEPEHPARVVLATDARLPGGKEHIVVVDDEKAIVNYLERLLGWLGYRVTAFMDSRQALEYLGESREPPDLLVTDQTMPAMTGLELAAAVRRRWPDLPIVLCTGYSAQLNEAVVRQAGIGVVLAKPVAREELAVTIRRMLDQGRAARS